MYFPFPLQYPYLAPDNTSTEPRGTLTILQAGIQLKLPCTHSQKSLSAAEEVDMCAISWMCLVAGPARWGLPVGTVQAPPRGTSEEDPSAHIPL